MAGASRPFLPRRFVVGWGAFRMRASFLPPLLFSCVVLGARGEVRWVDTALDESGDGTTPETAFATLEDAVYAAGAGDEIRVLGGAHRTVALGATTNGLVLAQEGLRLVGWGSVPPTLLADEDVPRSRGEALVHLAGADQVVSNLCFRFSAAGAGEPLLRRRRRRGGRDRRRGAPRDGRGLRLRADGRPRRLSPRRRDRPRRLPARRRDEPARDGVLLPQRAPVQPRVGLPRDHAARRRADRRVPLHERLRRRAVPEARRRRARREARIHRRNFVRLQRRLRLARDDRRQLRRRPARKLQRPARRRDRLQPLRQSRRRALRLGRAQAARGVLDALAAPQHRDRLRGVRLGRARELSGPHRGPHLRQPPRGRARRAPGGGRRGPLVVQGRLLLPRQRPLRRALRRHGRHQRGLRREPRRRALGRGGARARSALPLLRPARPRAPRLRPLERRLRPRRRARLRRLDGRRRLPRVHRRRPARSGDSRPPAVRAPHRAAASAAARAGRHLAREGARPHAPGAAGGLHRRGAQRLLAHRRRGRPHGLALRQRLLRGRGPRDRRPPRPRGRAPRRPVRRRRRKRRLQRLLEVAQRPAPLPRQGAREGRPRGEAALHGLPRARRAARARGGRLRDASRRLDRALRLRPRRAVAALQGQPGRLRAAGLRALRLPRRLARAARRLPRAAGGHGVRARRRGVRRRRALRNDRAPPLRPRARGHALLRRGDLRDGHHRRAARPLLPARPRHRPQRGLLRRRRRARRRLRAAHARNTARASRTRTAPPSRPRTSPSTRR